MIEGSSWKQKKTVLVKYIYIKRNDRGKKKKGVKGEKKREKRKGEEGG